jgi:serine protease
MRRRQTWYSTRPLGVPRGVWILFALGFAGILGSLGATIASAAPSHARPHISGTSYLRRWGVVPRRVESFDVLGSSADSVLGASSAADLSYQGGVGGVAVTTAPPKVYLVFYGSQWGTQSTTSLGGRTYASFGGDPQAMAPDLQAFFAGLGTNNDLWSGVMTQYCQSTSTVTVATGATTCPAGAAQVGYPSGGALAGVWEDVSAPSPADATQAQLAAEAEAAAAHFGNLTSAANRNVQYFIVSPTGTDPDGFIVNSVPQYCAWHTYTGGTEGNVAYTNLPYVPDAGYSCGANFVNASGPLDGVTMVAGHEYAETITDQFPIGGWYNTTYGEAADICAWNANGGTSTDLVLATGSFAVQPIWSNDGNACLTSHPIDTANVVAVTPPANQTSTLNSPITGSPRVTASDSGSGQTLTFSASGLPAGLVIDPTTGIISGTPTAAIYNASVTITATDTTGATGTASFGWTVSNPGGNTVSVANPVAQSNTLNTPIAALTITASDNQANQTLSYSATGLPAGLSINASTGSITGTPTAAGKSSVTVTVSDATSATGAATFTWTITGPTTMTVTSPGNQSTPLNTTISGLQIVAYDGTGNPLTYSASGLPSGLSLNATGLITGKTGTKAQTASVTITVTDAAAGVSGTTSFTWKVANTVTVRSPGNQTSTHNVAIAPLQIVASDSQTGATLTYSVTGLPSGLRLNSSTGVISGTPTRARAVASVTATVKDGSGASGSVTFSWKVN